MTGPSQAVHPPSEEAGLIQSPQLSMTVRLEKSSFILSSTQFCNNCYKMTNSEETAQIAGEIPIDSDIIVTLVISIDQINEYH